MPLQSHNNSHHRPPCTKHNTYRDPLLRERIRSNRIAEQFEEGSYNSGVTKTESGNVYVYAGDSTTRSILQVYEDTLLELIQFHDDFSDLTAEDQAFAVEVLQGIWME